MTLKHWWVITEEYGSVVPALDWGQGPIEYHRDAIEIEAATRRDALVLGVHEMLRLGWDWCNGNRNNGISPFAGVKALSDEEIELGDEVLP